MSILLIDKDLKNKNDRTWSFWSKQKETFEHIVFKSWSSIMFADTAFSKTYEIAPYAYKMIRGIDFYEEVIPFLKSQANTDFFFGEIDNIQSTDTNVLIQMKDRCFYGNQLFKSYYDKPDFSNDHFVWQHFKGWVIQFEEDVFDPDQATFMDFRLEQDGETRFFYVLPHNKREALVEIAIFSGNIPDGTFYDPYMKAYIEKYVHKGNYTILEEELGAIPMTTFDFNKAPQNRIINIGTNGGSVKGSSGYAFRYIQKETDKILNHLKQDTLHLYKQASGRYKFYDKIFMNAILTGKVTGAEVFSRLFKKLKAQEIFKFLDEENNFLEDLRIFTAPPTLPFSKAFLEEVF